jgi:hypothetical protein
MGLPFYAVRRPGTSVVEIFNVSTPTSCHEIEFPHRPASITLHGEAALLAVGGDRLFQVRSLHTTEMIYGDDSDTETEIVQFIGDVLVRTTRRRSGTPNVNISTIIAHNIHTWSVLFSHELIPGQEFNLGTYPCLSWSVNEFRGVFFSNIWNTVERKSDWKAWSILEDLTGRNDHRIIKFAEGLRNVVTARVIAGQLHVLCAREDLKAYFMWRPAEAGGPFPLDLSAWSNDRDWSDESGALKSMMGDFLSDNLIALIPRDLATKKPDVARILRWRDHERKSKDGPVVESLSMLDEGESPTQTSSSDDQQALTWGELTLANLTSGGYGSRFDAFVDKRSRKLYILLKTARKAIVYVCEQ